MSSEDIASQPDSTGLDLSIISCDSGTEGKFPWIGPCFFQANLNEKYDKQDPMKNTTSPFVKITFYIIM